MLTSWGAESYKRDGKVVLDALPVRLAYLEAGQSTAPLPPIPEPPRLSLPELFQRAEERQSPPPAWLKFLSSHTTLPSTWGAMYEMLVENGVVESRVKQLQRVLIADRCNCPDWAPEHSLSLEQSAIGTREREAIRSSDFSDFSARERAGLRYAEALTLIGRVDNDIFEEVKEAFTWPEIVELGYAVASQAGPALVLSMLQTDRQ